MKFIKKISAISLMLVGLLLFSNFKSNEPKKSERNTNLIASILNSKTSCRPTSNMMLYVKTSLVKKSRGFKTINASVYLLDKVSGISTLLANENVIVVNYKDSVLEYDLISTNDDKSVLKSGDIILSSDYSNKYSFNELLKYEVVYNSYINSTNKLLKIKRAI